MLQLVRNSRHRSRAAENGSGEAQFQMGVHSLDGIGVEKVKICEMWMGISNSNTAPSAAKRILDFRRRD
jgi:hypothetical protein